MNETVKNVLRRARWRFRAAAGRDVYVRPDVHREVVAVGGDLASGYGAWHIVAGSLTPESVVYSVGIGDDVSFDIELIRRFGVTIHAFDPTPESQTWLEAQALPERFHARPVALAATDGPLALYANASEGVLSHSALTGTHTRGEAVEVDGRRLATLMRENGHDHVDLLKMDVEGAEYEVLTDLLRSGADVRQLLVEFHHRFPEIGPGATREAIAALRGAGYRVFHVSATGREYGFIRT
ncbi:MAG TPA: FkbM family methyltransferase [Bacteroidetes bacterium]|nr:FkbM family methyltransferase [Bacteroidota bacterium]